MILLKWFYRHYIKLNDLIKSYYIYKKYGQNQGIYQKPKFGIVYL
jgi:hypothetical protein